MSLDQTSVDTSISSSVMRMLFTDDGRPPRDRSLIVPDVEMIVPRLRVLDVVHRLLMVVAAQHEVHAHLGERAEHPLRVLESVALRELALHRIVVHHDDARVARAATARTRRARARSATRAGAR